MNSSDFAFDRWVRRALAFAERCRKLPGKTRIEAQADAPLSQEQVVQMARKLPLGIPDPVKGFLVQGSAHCGCHYVWDLAGAAAKQFLALFPESERIYGGAAICDASSFEHYQAVCRSGAPDYQPDSELWLRSVPFAFIDNGDYLALDVGAGSATPPVVYLSNDWCGKSQAVAPSFEHFLYEWEGLCYIGPEHWRVPESQDRLCRLPPAERGEAP
jgi:SMI1/KNR4 family protein SUKH-1